MSPFGNIVVNRRLASVRRFNDLILNRVREVLLVSSPYDHFILQEDGSLTEQVFMEYHEFSLSAAPRFTHVANGAEAMEKLDDDGRHFDLILVMASVSDSDVNAFGRMVKRKRPDMPVVLLSLDQGERKHWLSRIDRRVIDGVFVWSGDSQILLAIVKYVEDRWNVDYDVKTGNVRVIVMIEDSPRYYSVFLRVLYKRLMSLAQSLYSEGRTELHRLMYMRSRPKLVHATSYEEASDLLHRYRANMFALISDVSIPRAGQIAPRAGLDFAREARALMPHLPILLQSAETDLRREAEAISAAFVDKNSADMLAELESFLTERLGFGDFVFRTPSGRALGRAKDLLELEEKLATLPAESLVYHASHNHFSLWLTARSEFEIAEVLRPRTVGEFADAEELRAYMIAALREARESMHSGIVADFQAERAARIHFSRIGSGYLGGKARGIAFLNKLLSEKEWHVQGLRVLLPKTIVLTTDEFDRFLERNHLREFARKETDDVKIRERFLACRLSEEAGEDLRAALRHLSGPLAVRSSSLLEDSLHQPFAGIYSTLMIPNNNPDFDYRFKDLCAAIKSVYVSTFSQNAKSYLRSTGKRVEEEKMAVIIQELVGEFRGDRFYPSFSGVAQSHNFYPVGPQKSEDGVALVALGLGRYIVEGGLALRFSPKHPEAIPQFADPAAFVKNSQREFWAMDLTAQRPPGEGLEDTLRLYELRAAEKDGALLPLASVYSASEEQIRDDLSQPGPRVVTFNNILKHRAIPLAEALCRVLEMTSAGLAGAVEVEFACEMGDWGMPAGRVMGRVPPALYLLQFRPLEVQAADTDVSNYQFDRDDLLCASELSLGHGVSQEIRDIVYVRRQSWDSSRNLEIVSEIDKANRRLTAEGRPYLLIGPGRWGSADRWLGIPVEWSQISGARVIVEASPGGYAVDPSQGSHFFHNMTSLGIGYITLPPGADKQRGDAAFLDWEWLDSRPDFQETAHVRSVRLEQPLTVALDGRAGKAALAKPGRLPLDRESPVPTE